MIIITGLNVSLKPISKCCVNPFATILTLNLITNHMITIMTTIPPLLLLLFLLFTCFSDKETQTNIPESL